MADGVAGACPRAFSGNAVWDAPRFAHAPTRLSASPNQNAKDRNNHEDTKSRKRSFRLKPVLLRVLRFFVVDPYPRRRFLTPIPPIGYVARSKISLQKRARTMLSEYRQRFGELHTELQREEHLVRSGHKTRRDTASILAEHSDLFAPSATEELRAALDATPDSRATERAAIRHLIAFSVEGHLAARVRDVSEEIESYEAGARADWNGEKRSIRELEELLAGESDAARRRDLFARRSGLVRAARDLRAEREERLRDAARALGYENRLRLHRELRGVDLETLAEPARKILSRTESRYVTALASLLPRETGVSIDDATEAELPRLQRFDRFDHFFSRDRMLGIYRNLFANLGFKTEQQSNVEIDSAPRPGKQLEAFCAPIRIPDEIKLVFTARGGQANYREFLREAGHAQHAAWTSRNLYPEFQIGGDPAVREAWGLLLEHLLLDAHWLMSAFGFVESDEFRHAMSVFRLLAARKEAALLSYEADFHAGKLSGNAGTQYAELMADAVRVRFDETNHLLAPDAPFASAHSLRARAFESQLREHLKTKFGLRWWASRKVGETLIDLWNTGQRHSVEELASMIGFGAMDFEWLTAELLEGSEESVCQG
jgi:hypothetical protein